MDEQFNPSKTPAEAQGSSPRGDDHGSPPITCSVAVPAARAEKSTMLGGPIGATTSPVVVHTAGRKAPRNISAS